MKKDDALQERRDWERRVHQELFPKLRDSAVFLSINPGEDGWDAEFCVGLGAAILLNKPILLVVPPGREVPPGLRKVADRIVPLESLDDMEHNQALRQALEELIRAAAAG